MDQRLENIAAEKAAVKAVVQEKTGLIAAQQQEVETRCAARREEMNSIGRKVIRLINAKEPSRVDGFEKIMDVSFCNPPMQFTITKIYEQAS